MTTETHNHMYYGPDPMTVLLIRIYEFLPGPREQREINQIQIPQRTLGEIENVTIKNKIHKLLPTLIVNSIQTPLNRLSNNRVAHQILRVLRIFVDLQKH